MTDRWNSSFSSIWTQARSALTQAVDTVWSRFFGFLLLLLKISGTINVLRVDTWERSHYLLVAVSMPPYWRKPHRQTSKPAWHRLRSKVHNALLMKDDLDIMKSLTPRQLSITATLTELAVDASYGRGWRSKARWTAPWEPFSAKKDSLHSTAHNRPQLDGLHWRSTPLSRFDCPSAAQNTFRYVTAILMTHRVVRRS